MSQFEFHNTNPEELEQVLWDSARKDPSGPSASVAWDKFLHATSSIAARVDGSQSVELEESHPRLRRDQAASPAAGSSATELSSSIAVNVSRSVALKTSAWVLGGAAAGSLVTVLLIGQLSSEVPRGWPGVTVPQTFEVQDRSVSALSEAPGESHPFKLQVDDQRSSKNAGQTATRTLPPAVRSVALEPNAKKTGSTLAQEVERLDSARRLLKSGAYGAALDRVSDYHTDFPRGVLAPEAETIAIEALIQVGRVDTATQRAERFITNYPDDPQLPRIMEVLDGL